MAGQESSARYDAVVLATGYERQHHRDLLAPLAPWLGDWTVDRHYRLRSAGAFRPAVFLQGACESSHGLSDTLLSITAVRTGEIGEALLRMAPASASASPSAAAPVCPPASPTAPATPSPTERALMRAL